MSSQLDRIANLLLSQIRSRQTLAIGTAQSAAIQGTRALYQTPSGIISAIATNFCYGDCLLAKVEGTWYAINPVDNREVVRSSVDRLIQRRAKSIIAGGTDKFVGIGSSNLVYAFFNNLVNTDSYAIVDNVFGSNENIDNEYWRVFWFDGNFFRWVDSADNGNSININQAVFGNALSWFYIGASTFYVINPSVAQVINPDGVSSFSELITPISLANYPPADSRFSTVSPILRTDGNSNTQSQLRVASYGDWRYQAVSFEIYWTGYIEPLQFPYGVFGNLRQIYEQNLSKLPILVGQVTLLKCNHTPLELTSFSAQRNVGEPRTVNLNNIRRLSFETYNINTLYPPTFTIGSLAIKINAYWSYLIESGYTLTPSKVTFTQALYYQKKYLAEVHGSAIESNPIVYDLIRYDLTGQGSEITSCQVAVITEGKIYNGQVTSAITRPQTISGPGTNFDPLNEYVELTSITYSIRSEYVHDSQFRAAIFVGADLFDPLDTILVASTDGIAKLYKTVIQYQDDTIPTLYALEFLVATDGSVDLTAIHPGVSAGVPVLPPVVNAQNKIYYPGY